MEERRERSDHGAGTSVILGDIVGPIGDESDWKAAQDPETDEVRKPEGGSCRIPIWIWRDVEAHRRSSEVTKVWCNPENEIYLSTVSLWEAILLLKKRRTILMGDFGDWFKKSKLELGLIEVPLNWGIAHEIRYTNLDIATPGTGFWWPQRRCLISLW